METSETKQNKAASVVIQTAVILFGLTVYAAGVVLFILPLDMIAAGTTGLGLMAQHFFGIPLSGFVAVFNIAMFGLGWLERWGKNLRRRPCLRHFITRSSLTA